MAWATTCRARRFSLLGIAALKEFWRYQGVSQAAALGFYALLSFIPLIFLILAIAGMIWGDTAELQEFIEKQDKLLMPWVQQTLESRMHSLLQQAAGLGGVSLLAIFWTSGLFLAVLQNSLLLPWATEHSHKKGVWRWAMPWIFGPALGVILPVAMLLMHLGAYLPEWFSIRYLPALGAWCVFFGGIFMVYKLFIPLHVSWRRCAFLSLLISGASLALTLFFSHILAALPGYTRIYGSLAGIILFLLWLEYNMAVILWGGHVLRLWQEGQAC